MNLEEECYGCLADITHKISIISFMLHSVYKAKLPHPFSWCGSFFLIYFNETFNKLSFIFTSPEAIDVTSLNASVLATIIGVIVR